MVEYFLLIVRNAIEKFRCLSRYTVGLPFIRQEAEPFQANHAFLIVLNKLLLYLLELFFRHFGRFADKHDQRLLSPIRLPDNQVSPEALLGESVVNIEHVFHLLVLLHLFIVVLHECLSKGYNELGVFADDFDLDGSFNHYGLFVVVAFVEPDNRFSFIAQAHREF